MIRQCLVEILIDLQGIVLAGGARQEAAVSLDRAQRRRVGFVGLRVTLAGVFGVLGEIEDEPGMQVLEDAVPIRAGQLVDGVDRAMGIAGARERPCRQQCRRQIGHRTAHRLGEVLPGGPVVFLLQLADADHEMRDAIGMIARKHPLGELARILDIAVGKHREEGAAQQIGIVRVEFEHIEVIVRRGAGVALGAGMPRSQITARGILRQQVLLRRRLAGNGSSGKRRRKAQSDGEANNGGVPRQQRMIHEISIIELNRLANWIGGAGIERPMSLKSARE